MKKIAIFDPTQKDDLANFRGGGRILQILKENLQEEAKFVGDFKKVERDDALLVPTWNPFSLPLLNKRITNKQYLIIFDVIPLKHPDHFPAGARGRVKLLLNKRALKHYDKIITISHRSKTDIIRYLGIEEDKIKVVYPTMSKMFTNLKKPARHLQAQASADGQGTRNKQISSTNEQIRNSKYQIPDTKYCLYVGDVNWNKNLVNLARAIKIINVTCVFAGTMFQQVTSYKLQVTRNSHPWLAEFKQFLTEVGDDKRFIFAGYVSDRVLVKLYKKARLNVLVSRDEGFGLSYLEAATQKSPSVLSDIDVFHEVADKAALFTKPDDPYKIANTIGELYFNPIQAHELGQKAYERSKTFSPERFKRQLIRILL